MHLRDLFDLSGKVALVTGGSRGLGREMAVALGEAGARLVITARRRQWLDEAESELRERGFHCLAITCDVASEDQVQASVQRALEHFGRIDILVNNAGITWGAPALEMPLGKWRQVINVNVTGTFMMSQAVGRHMRDKGGGKIINVSSITGLRGLAHQVLDAVGYSTSKGAIVALTKDLAVKWARYNIQVNAIAPGFFPTRLTEFALSQSRERIIEAVPMGRLGQGDDLKGVVVFLASPASNYITGQVIAVDGGLTSSSFTGHG